MRNWLLALLAVAMPAMALGPERAAAQGVVVGAGPVAVGIGLGPAWYGYAPWGYYAPGYAYSSFYGYAPRAYIAPRTRVYGYTREAHVKFNHAPHIRAKVECSTCHGNIGQQTVAQRNVDLNLGFCVTCHRENNAPTDCLACHF